MPAKPSSVLRCGSCEFERFRRTGAVETATCNDDDRPLALEQTFGTGLAVAEGAPGPQHMVEPGFKRRRNAEIVHRRADDDRVGLLHFGDQSIGQSARRLLRVRHRVLAAHSAEGFARQMRDRLVRRYRASRLSRKASTSRRRSTTFCTSDLETEAAPETLLFRTRIVDMIFSGGSKTTAQIGVSKIELNCHMTHKIVD